MPATGSSARAGQGLASRFQNSGSRKSASPTPRAGRRNHGLQRCHYPRENTLALVAGKGGGAPCRRLPHAEQAVDGLGGVVLLCNRNRIGFGHAIEDVLEVRNARSAHDSRTEK